MHRRRPPLILLVAMSLTFGSACAPASSGTNPATTNSPASPSTSAPSAATPIKVRAAYTTIAGAVAPWWMAVEGGYFREQGLDLELVLVEPGVTLLAALRNGELDVTYSGAPAV